MAEVSAVTVERPTCPDCKRPIDRMQHSRGVVATYPCLCWLSPARATAAVQEWRDRRN